MSMDAIQTVLVIVTVLGVGGWLWFLLHQAQGRLVSQQQDILGLQNYAEETISDVNGRFYKLMEDLEPLLVPMRDYKDSLLGLTRRLDNVPWEDVEERFGEFQFILEQFSDIDWTEAATLLRGLMEKIPSLVPPVELNTDGLSNQIEILGR